jgi:hypothetical protein
MQTSLLRKCENARADTKYFDAKESYAAMANREGVVIGMLGCVI